MSEPGAVAAMTRSQAIDWAPHGIRVNAIAPTFVWTPMAEPMLKIQQVHDASVPGGPAALWGFVALDFDYRETPLHETVESLLEAGKSPIYIVNFTQRECAELAQSLHREASEACFIASSVNFPVRHEPRVEERPRTSLARAQPPAEGEAATSPRTGSK